MFERDPEELGPEHPDDLALRLHVAASVHSFWPGDDGRCDELIASRHDGEASRCGRERHSVLHDDPEADFRARHDHGGGSCMCFEDDNGPTYHEAMAAYVADRR